MLVFGEFQELKNKDAEKARHILLDRVFPLMTSSTIHAHDTERKEDRRPAKNQVKHIMYRIKIKLTGSSKKDRVVGSPGMNPSMKHDLKNKAAKWLLYFFC